MVAPGAAGKGGVGGIEAAEGQVVDDDAPARPVEPAPTPKRTKHRQLDRRLEPDPEPWRVGETKWDRENDRRLGRPPPATVDVSPIITRDANLPPLPWQNPNSSPPLLERLLHFPG